MNIVESAADDLTLKEAAELAGYNEKTLRRAVQDGQFPRRYAMSPRGPQLLFKRSVLEGWIASRQAGSSGRRRGRPAEQTNLLSFGQRVAQFQKELEDSRAIISRLNRTVDSHGHALRQAQDQLLRLARKVSVLEADAEQPATREPGA